jgi:hypothetical protein
MALPPLAFPSEAKRRKPWNRDQIYKRIENFELQYAIKI